MYKRQENGTVCGIKLPEGLKESDKLPEPIYTPSTKAEIGDHDENISFEQSIDHLEKYFPGKGREYAETVSYTHLDVYKRQDLLCMFKCFRYHTVKTAVDSCGRSAGLSCDKVLF